MKIVQPAGIICDYHPRLLKLVYHVQFTSYLTVMSRTGYVIYLGVPPVNETQP
ncbi:MAG: hypothetical protein QM270_08565 [Bacillota bacterium]|nr:hypothetical protein [Bacillota bacterium]